MKSLDILALDRRSYYAIPLFLLVWTLSGCKEKADPLLNAWNEAPITATKYDCLKMAYTVTGDEVAGRRNDDIAKLMPIRSLWLMIGSGVWDEFIDDVKLVAG